MNRKKVFSTAVLLVLVVAGLVFADIAQIGYQNLRGAAPTAAQSGVASPDTTTWSAVPLKPYITNGNPSVAAYVGFTSAGATSNLILGLYFKNADGSYTYHGNVKTVLVTAAASGTTDPNGFFPGLAVATFDTLGAAYYDLRVATISAGSVTVVPWAYGSNSRGHE